MLPLCIVIHIMKLLHSISQYQLCFHCSFHPHCCWVTAQILTGCVCSQPNAIVSNRSDNAPACLSPYQNFHPLLTLSRGTQSGAREAPPLDKSNFVSVIFSSRINHSPALVTSLVLRPLGNDTVTGDVCSILRGRW